MIDIWNIVIEFSEIKNVLNILSLSKSMVKLNKWNYLSNRDFGKNGYTKNEYMIMYLEKQYNEIMKKNIGYGVINIDNKNLHMLFNNNLKTSTLSIQYNNIEKIPANWMPQVNILYLDFNNIKEIDKNWVPDIEVISLEFNQITSIPEDWNIELYDLYLCHNSITSISPKWKPKIRNLFLYGNNIHESDIQNLIESGINVYI